MNDVIGFASIQQMREWISSRPDLRRAMSRLHAAVDHSPRWRELWPAAERALIGEGVPPAADTVGALLIVLMADRVERRVHSRGGVGGREMAGGRS